MDRNVLDTQWRKQVCKTWPSRCILRRLKILKSSETGELHWMPGWAWEMEAWKREKYYYWTNGITCGEPWLPIFWKDTLQWRKIISIPFHLLFSYLRPFAFSLHQFRYISSHVFLLFISRFSLFLAIIPFFFSISILSFIFCRIFSSNIGILFFVCMFCFFFYFQWRKC